MEIKCSPDRQWIDIPRDAAGFASDEALDELWEHRPFLLRYRDGTIILVNSELGPDWGEWRPDVSNHPQRYQWMSIPKY